MPHVPFLQDKLMLKYDFTTKICISVPPAPNTFFIRSSIFSFFPRSCMLCLSTRLHLSLVLVHMGYARIANIWTSVRLRTILMISKCRKHKIIYRFEILLLLLMKSKKDRKSNRIQCILDLAIF